MKWTGLLVVCALTCCLQFHHCQGRAINKKPRSIQKATPQNLRQPRSLLGSAQTHRRYEPPKVTFKVPLFGTDYKITSILVNVHVPHDNKEGQHVENHTPKYEKHRPNSDLPYGLVESQLENKIETRISDDSSSAYDYEIADTDDYYYANNNYGGSEEDDEDDYLIDPRIDSASSETEADDDAMVMLEVEQVDNSSRLLVSEFENITKPDAKISENILNENNDSNFDIVSEIEVGKDYADEETIKESEESNSNTDIITETEIKEKNESDFIKRKENDSQGDVYDNLEANITAKVTNFVDTEEEIAKSQDDNLETVTEITIETEAVVTEDGEQDYEIYDSREFKNITASNPKINEDLLNDDNDSNIEVVSEIELKTEYAGNETDDKIIKENEESSIEAEILVESESKGKKESDLIKNSGSNLRTHDNDNLEATTDIFVKKSNKDKIHDTNETIKTEVDLKAVDKRSDPELFKNHKTSKSKQGVNLNSSAEITVETEVIVAEDGVQDYEVDDVDKFEDVTVSDAETKENILNDNDDRNVEILSEIEASAEYKDEGTIKESEESNSDTDIIIETEIQVENESDLIKRREVNSQDDVNDNLEANTIAKVTNFEETKQEEIAKSQDDNLEAVTEITVETEAVVTEDDEQDYEVDDVVNFENITESDAEVKKDILNNNDDSNVEIESKIKASAEYADEETIKESEESNSDTDIIIETEIKEENESDLIKRRQTDSQEDVNNNLKANTAAKVTNFVETEEEEIAKSQDDNLEAVTEITVETEAVVTEDGEEDHEVDDVVKFENITESDAEVKKDILNNNDDSNVEIVSEIEASAEYADEETIKKSEESNSDTDIIIETEIKEEKESDLIKRRQTDSQEDVNDNLEANTTAKVTNFVETEKEEIAKSQDDNLEAVTETTVETEVVVTEDGEQDYEADEVIKFKNITESDAEVKKDFLNNNDDGNVEIVSEIEASAEYADEETIKKNEESNSDTDIKLEEINEKNESEFDKISETDSHAKDDDKPNDDDNSESITSIETKIVKSDNNSDGSFEKIVQEAIEDVSNLEGNKNK